MKPLSIRFVLIFAMMAMGFAGTISVGGVGMWTIVGKIREAEQKSVNRGLYTVRDQYEQRLLSQNDRIAEMVRLVDFNGPDVHAQLTRAREAYRLDVLNICGPSGEPQYGTYPTNATAVPVADDPVIRRALLGRPSYGTVVLSSKRLQDEGGAALAKSLSIARAGGQATGKITDALFAWTAHPIRDDSGRVLAVLYGGRALNLNYDLVDGLREIVFGGESYGSKPLGTVTFFLGDERVATNVKGPYHERAVGTRVSEEVRNRVLKEGQRWQARALVVDTWYFSAYEPLRDPDGAIVGMLYVGLLQAPYADLQWQLITQLLLVLGAVAFIAIPIVFFLVIRIANPLKTMADAARAMANGERAARVVVPTSYRELTVLGAAFRDMQGAIAERDQSLQQQNSELLVANDRFAHANGNYMKTLGFVTHELKSPLAAMQTMIDSALPIYRAQIPEQLAVFMGRIKQGLEELQDMVKNYLDLSRAERGELEVHPVDIELRKGVIEPAVIQVDSLFRARQVTLEIQSPPGLCVFADPELLRLALVNYLNNAAKYGREGGKARVEVRIDDDQFVLSVWNEGPGFNPDEHEKLFRKFSRLKNENTRDRRGSGLGLYLVREIVTLHGGKTWAESTPGEWARFSLTIPRQGTTISA